MEDWIWLVGVFGAGSSSAYKLLQRYSDVSTVRSAVNSGEIKLSDYRAKLNEEYGLLRCRQIIMQCRENDIDIITLKDNKYPAMLRDIDTPPLVLFCKGDISFLNKMPCVCIVGSRETDEYGIKATFTLSARLSFSGFAIVSGGAKGIDSAAHVGCSSVFGKTCLILPCGHLYRYLPGQDPMKDKILKNGGAIISEYLPEQYCAKRNFKVRNRILSGLSLCVAVTCAHTKSGANLTVAHALEQGKDVFVAKPPKNPNADYRGNLLLLDDGATELLSAKQITDEYQSQYPHKIDSSNAYGKLSNKVMLEAFNLNKGLLSTIDDPEDYMIYEPVEEEAPLKSQSKVKLSEDAEAVYRSIKDDLFTPDCLNIELDSLKNSIFLALFELERAGLIESAPSGYYRRIG